MLTMYCNYHKKQNKKVMTLIVVNVGNLGENFYIGDIWEQGRRQPLAWGEEGGGAMAPSIFFFF